MRYNYIEKVPDLYKYKRNNTIFDNMYRIQDNIEKSTGILIQGKSRCKNAKDLRMGNITHFKMGKCDKNSDVECIGKERHIIVDNMPPNIANNQGLIPNIIHDLNAFSPGNMFLNMSGRGEQVNSSCALEDVEFIELNPTKKSKKSRQKLCVSKAIEPFVSSKNNLSILIVLVLLIFILLKK